MNSHCLVMLKVSPLKFLTIWLYNSVVRLLNILSDILSNRNESYVMITTLNLTNVCLMYDITWTHVRFALYLDS